MFEITHKSALKNGLLVNKIEYSDNKRLIISKEIKLYNDEDITNYIILFNNLKEEGKIENKNFEDVDWIICEEDEYKKLRRSRIKFSFESKRNINNILKAYTINLIINAISINVITQEIKIIKNIIFNSNFFNVDMINEFEEYIESLDDTKRVVTKDKAMKFISFIRDRVNNVYCDYLSSLPNDYNKYVREIPDYTSILKFDFFVDKYIKENNDELFYKYCSIFLWWKISSKIPLRVCEFMLLRKDSFYEKNGKFYIVVKRLKPHGFINKALKIRKIQTFRINKEIYELVKKVIDNEFHDSDYLLSKSLYNKYYDKYEIKEKNSESNVMTRANLYKCLEDFYYDEIYLKYNQYLLSKNDIKRNNKISKADFIKEGIVCLQLGDARHLAIINLVLQGTNAYLIKEMCGHRDINSHSHYIDHAKAYISSKVLVLTDFKKMEIELFKKNTNLTYKNKRNEKISMYNVKDYKKVGDYYCKRYIGRENLFPFLCITDCEECNDKVLKLSNREVDIIDDEINKNNSDIENQIKIIELYMGRNLNNLIDKKREKIFFESQQNLCEASCKLEYLISKKAELEAEKYYSNIIEN